MELLDLLKEKGVLYGSRALNVHTEESDYDFAILHTDVLVHKELFMDAKFSDPLNHFQIVPEAPSQMMYKVKLYEDKDGFNNRADILVLSDEDDLQVVADAVSDVKDIPLYMLKVKKLRIQAYQLAQKNYGWQSDSSRNYQSIEGFPQRGYSFRQEEELKTLKERDDKRIEIIISGTPEEVSSSEFPALVDPAEERFRVSSDPFRQRPSLSDSMSNEDFAWIDDDDDFYING